MKREDDPVFDAIGALPGVEEPVLRFTSVAAFPCDAARAPPLHYATCLSRRADIILIAHGAELLARDVSDARTTGVVPLKLGKCRHGSRRRELGVSPKVDAEKPERPGENPDRHP